MKKITAKFNSICTETGQRIKKGDSMYYDYSTKKCYCLNSKKATEINDISLANYVQAEQDEYFDNFCVNNNI